LSHAIFRVQGIKTTNDLRGIGKHNLDRVSLTNDDIDSSRSSENIHLIESESYLKKFFTRVEPMKQEHDEKMKTERKDRVKSFEGKINSAKNDVACEFLFTSDTKFFEGKSKEDIQAWGQQSLDFVEKEIGIDKKNILHAVIHMDESTPHLHIVAVPLVNKYDGRSKKDTWQLNRKHFIETKEDMANLQDKYFEHMKNAGHNLERGQKGSERHHLSVEEFKAESIKKEIEALQDERETLREDVDSLLTDVKGLKRAVVYAKDIKAMDNIKPSVIDRKHVRIPVQDFEELKTKAKATEAFKHESLENLSIAVEQERLVWDLTKKNEVLQQENGELKTENLKLTEMVKSQEEVINYLQDTLSSIKRNSLQFLDITIDKMREYVGIIRGYTLFENFGQKAFQKVKLDLYVPTDEKVDAENRISTIDNELKAEQRAKRKAEQEKLEKQLNQLKAFLEANTKKALGPKKQQEELPKENELKKESEEQREKEPGEQQEELQKESERIIRKKDEYEMER
jgi:hypothetical protein